MSHAPATTPLHRRNVALLGVEMALFFTALGLIAPLTLVPLFVSKLTDNPLAIGGLTAAFQLGWLPQLFAAPYVERSARKLPWVFLFSGLERLPSLGLALCALATPLVPAPLIVGAVCILMFTHAFGAGLATTPWLDIIARAVPSEWRGKWMGGFTTAGTLLGAGLAALAAPLLDRLGFPYGFAACFGLGFAVLAGCYGLLFFIVEPPGPPPRPARPFGEQVGDVLAVLVDDARFRRFLTGLGLASLGMMGAGFLVVYGVERLGADDEQAAWYTVALLVGQVVANLGLGWLADRSGFTVAARVTAIGGALAGVVALAAPTAAWLLLAYGLIGVLQAGILLARLVGPIVFAPSDRRPTYVALGGASIGLVAAIGPLIGGQIVATLGYPWLFAAGLTCCLASALVLSPSRSSGTEIPTGGKP